MKLDHINFDCTEFIVGEAKTDVIGNITNVMDIFPQESFSGILCSHVLEHFYPDDAFKVLGDCYKLLKPGGEMVVECPDITKIMKLFVSGATDEAQTIKEIYGDSEFLLEYGATWMHKWGWTGKRVAEVMSKIGFNIIEIGDGITHHHPERDLRVKGKK